MNKGNIQKEQSMVSVKIKIRMMEKWDKSERVKVCRKIICKTWYSTKTSKSMKKYKLVNKY